MTKIVISDSAGTIVQTLAIGKDAAAGLNRVWWDLRMDPTDQILLRTRPLHEAEFALTADGTRKFPTAATVSCSCHPASTP